MQRTISSQSFFFCLFSAILLLDWFCIFVIQQEADMISHWVIALPLFIPLFSALCLLAMIGIYVNNPWGFAIAYLALILSLFFTLFSYFLFNTLSVWINLQIFLLLILNLYGLYFLISLNIEKKKRLG